MNPISILIVDDDEPTLRILRQWLESRGHRIQAASSGHEALRQLNAAPADLVITDVLMPDGNGLDLIGKLKSTYPQTKILAISGGGPHVSSSSCLVRAHHSGAHALLLKPFKPDQLLEAMRYVIGQDVRGESPANARKAGRTRDLAFDQDLAATQRSREHE